MEGKGDTKITDFFPTSPNGTATNKDAKSDQVKDEVTPTPFLTPDSTPTKDKTNAGKTAGDTDGESTKNKLKEKTEDSVTADTSEPVVETKDEVATPVVSGKKRRGRKKGKGKKAQEKIEVADSPQARPSSRTTQRRRKTKKEETPSHQLTEYFPVRRSDRRLKTDFEKQKKQMLEEAILTGSEDGLKVVEFEGKGRGVLSTKRFERGDFVVEYYGDLIDLSKAKAKEEEYSQNPDVGCYMYYFSFNNKRYCVDATAESGRLGRLLNHSKNGNCKTKVVGINNRPYLILVAARDISIGEEMLYDYGDRSKEAIEAHPWLAK